MSINTFLKRVAITSYCWNWKGHKDKKGYGVFNTTNKTFLAHRFSYLSFVGPIKKSLVLDHICNNKGCVNPKHLRQITNGLNLLRGRLKIKNDFRLYSFNENWNAIEE